MCCLFVVVGCLFDVVLCIVLLSLVLLMCLCLFCCVCHVFRVCVFCAVFPCLRCFVFLVACCLCVLVCDFLLCSLLVFFFCQVERCLARFFRFYQEANTSLDIEIQRGIETFYYGSNTFSEWLCSKRYSRLGNFRTQRAPRFAGY